MSGPPAELSAPLGYAQSGIERFAERRDDAAFLDREAADPRARFYALLGEVPVLRRASAPDPLFARDGLSGLGPVREEVYLGRAGDSPRFARLIGAAAEEAVRSQGELLVQDLRSLAVEAALDPHHLGALGLAKSLLSWHARHRFCANCGTATSPAAGGWKRLCAACGAQHFPRVDPVVIMLVADGERCLLGRQARFPAGSYSCLAGFVEPGETLEDAARREIREEAGVLVGRVGYLAAQPWPFPSSMMIGMRGEALTTEITVDATELEDARWFGRDEVRLMLAREHPGGLIVPPPFSIAHRLLRLFAEAAAQPASPIRAA